MFVGQPWLEKAISKESNQRTNCRLNGRRRLVMVGAQSVPCETCNQREEDGQDCRKQDFVRNFAPPAVSVRDVIRFRGCAGSQTLAMTAIRRQDYMCPTGEVIIWVLTVQCINCHIWKDLSWSQADSLHTSNLCCLCRSALKLFSSHSVHVVCFVMPHSMDAKRAVECWSYAISQTYRFQYGLTADCHTAR